MQKPPHKYARSVCTLPAIYAAPKVAGGSCKRTDARRFRVAEPAHEGGAHDLGQASGSRVAEPAHMVKVHDVQVLECRVAEPAHVTSEKAQGEPLHRDFAAAGARGRLWAHAPGSFAEETDHLSSRGVSDFFAFGLDSTVADCAASKYQADGTLSPHIRSDELRYACTSVNEQDAAQRDDFSF